MNDKKFEHYIKDLGVLIKEKAREAKINEVNSDAKNADYNIGYLMAFHEIIVLMKHQAMVFNIEQEDIGLADINAETDLL